MKTAIVTDSNSGIFQDEAKELGIFVVPMPMLIDDKEAYEGIDIHLDEFLIAQESGKQITTSQPAPANVMDLWDKILEDYDELVYLPMSSALSGSCNTAKMLSEDYDGKVVVVDNHRISVTLKVSALQALELSKEGKSALEIKEILEKDSYNASIYIAVDTLEYLKRGGRITPAAAAIGSVLNLKPILSILGGKLDAFAKVRGMNKAKKIMIETAANDLKTRFSEYSADELYIATAGSFRTKETADEWAKMVHEAFPEYEMMSDQLPLSIITHTGPDAMGIGVYPKKAK